MHSEFQTSEISMTADFQFSFLVHCFITARRCASTAYAVVMCLSICQSVLCFFLAVNRIQPETVNYGLRLRPFNLPKIRSDWTTMPKWTPFCSKVITLAPSHTHTHTQTHTHRADCSSGTTKVVGKNTSDYQHLALQSRAFHLSEDIVLWTDWDVGICAIAHATAISTQSWLF